MVALSLAILALFPAIALSQTVTYQLEDGVLSGVTVGTSVTGFTGTGYIEGFDATADSATISITSASQTLYDLSIVYSAPYGTKATTVVLNGAGGSQISLEETTSWTTVSAGQVLLNAGTNTISIQSNWGWYLIDSIQLTPSTPRAAHQVTSALVTPGSSAATKSLMAFLASKYGKAYISGQQDPASLLWVETNVGKSPAILGLDFIEYSPSRVEHGSTSTAVEDAIAWDARGGIVTFCWHWNAPTGLSKNGDEWWKGFYTASVDFSLATALSSTTNANYTLLIRDIDAIATQLKRLQAANVPILFRPLHEAEGGWFWWGASGAESCKQLYAILYNRLSVTHGLKNLVWVWNSVDPAWYPGAATVDVLSYDSYPATTGDHGPVSAQYNSLLAMGGDKKLVAAAEVGPIPDPDQIKAYQSDWSWFVTWGGEFVQNGVHNSLEFLKKVYTHPYVLNLDGVQGWKTFGASTTATASTTTSTKVTTTFTTTTTAASTTAVPKWGQCGGLNWTGSTTCVSGSTCQVATIYYSQCL